MKAHGRAVAGKSRRPSAPNGSSRQPQARRVTLTWAAGEVDLSVRQLQEYAKRPGSPRTADGKGGWLYEWPAFSRFVRECTRDDAVAEARPTDFEKTRMRNESAKADLAEMERDRLRGQLVEVNRFEEALTRAFGRIREKLIALAPRLAPELLGLKDEAVAEGLVDKYAQEIIEELQAGSDIPLDEPAEAAA